MNRYLYYIGLLLLLTAPLAFIHAQVNYQPITQIPFMQGSAPTAEAFVVAAYRISIFIAAMLALVKIVYGGVQWMLTDVITSKENAKKDIWGAIFGLIIVLSAVFILELINPRLKDFSLFRNAPAMNVGTQPSSDVAPTNSGGVGNNAPSGATDGGDGITPNGA